MDEVEKSLKVKESTHSGVLAVKMTGGYKSVDELIVERVLNGNKGSSRATKGVKQRGAHPIDQPGQDAGGDHTKDQNQGQSAESGADASEFVIE